VHTVIDSDNYRVAIAQIGYHDPGIQGQIIAGSG
jgi:hypothetical protein